jgi:hypothetical protein
MDFNRFMAFKQRGGRVEKKSLDGLRWTERNVKSGGCGRVMR